MTKPVNGQPDVAYDRINDFMNAVFKGLLK